jgi:nucleoside phosphorylase
VHFLSRPGQIPNDIVRSIVLRDLCWRLPHLDTLERVLVIAEAFPCILPEEVKDVFIKATANLSDFDVLRRARKEHKDVGIVTVIGKELQAVLTALGRSLDAPPDERSGEFSYWIADIVRPAGRPLKIVVTMVAEARNVPCAIAVEHMLSDYDIDALVLVGIAAGPSEKVMLGDVVYADQVYDYEEHRLEVLKWWGLTTWFRRQRPRPKYISTRKVVKIALERMNEPRFTRFFDKIVKGVAHDLLPGSYGNAHSPKVHDGTIAAGEKLIADGTANRMRRLDERIRAVAMEDSGFAQAAELAKLPWCIFRGISDYGDPRKANGWQFVSALGAACAAVIFLSFSWEPPKQ